MVRGHRFWFHSDLESPPGPAVEKLCDLGQVPEPLRVEDPSSKMEITNTFFSGQLEDYDSVKTASVISDKFRASVNGIGCVYLKRHLFNAGYVLRFDWFLIR